VHEERREKQSESEQTLSGENREDVLRKPFVCGFS
jgi:hypothetical protein